MMTPPTEIHSRICDYLSLEDLSCLSETCTYFRNVTNLSFFQRVRKYGYPEDHPLTATLAKKFISSLYKVVCLLKNDDLFQKAISYTDERIDLEKTLSNVSKLTPEEFIPILFCCFAIEHSNADQFYYFILKNLPSDSTLNKNEKGHLNRSLILFSDSSQPLGMKICLKLGADPDHILYHTHKANLGTNLSTALHCAAYTGNIEGVKLLLEKGANPNIDFGCGTPFFYCISNQRIIELLLESGAELNRRNHMGKTPLDIAREEGNTEAIEFLLDKSAKLRNKL